MRKHAFTLIELLIVVAIIAILAAIAVPNFLEAQTRARVSRAQNDLRSIDLAMESYRIDNNGYNAAYAAQVHKLLPTSTATGSDRRLLSTPIAYIDTVPKDIFRIIAGLAQPDYFIYGVAYAPGASYTIYPRTAWMTWSNGPDQLTEAGGYRTFKTIIANEALPVPLIGPSPIGTNGMRYDPTNGTISRGDIYRFGGEAMTH